MPSTIACPGCRRALTLPAESMNRLVQCPACKQQFHPAAAEAAAIPQSLPTPDYLSHDAKQTSGGKPDPRPPAHLPPPPMPRGDDPPRRSRRKRAEFDLCPKCDGRVPPHAERCPECGVEFETEKDEDYRPWEQSSAERRDSEPHRGNMILMLGIGSLILPALSVCFGFTALFGLGAGIAAIIMGRNDLRKIDQHIMSRDGRSSTHSGYICGIIGTILSALAIVAVLAYIAWLAF